MVLDLLEKPTADQYCLGFVLLDICFFLQELQFGVAVWFYIYNQVPTATAAAFGEFRFKAQ